MLSGVPHTECHRLCPPCALYSLLNSKHEALERTILCNTLWCRQCWPYWGITKVRTKGFSSVRFLHVLEFIAKNLLIILWKMQWTLQTCLCPLQISNKQLNSTDNKLRKHTVLSNLQTIKPTVAFWPYLPNYKIGVLLCICELAIYALYLLAFLVKMNLFVLLVKHHLQ